MLFADENHYCRGIWEMAKTTTCKALRYCEIFLPFQREKSMIMLVLLFRQATIHRSVAETIDVGRSLWQPDRLNQPQRASWQSIHRLQGSGQQGGGRGRKGQVEAVACRILQDRTNPDYRKRR